MKSYNPDNPFAQPDKLEQLTFTVTIEQMATLELVFEEVAFSFSSTAAEDAEGMHIVQILCDAADAEMGLAQTELQPTKREYMQERDWVSEVQADFKPMRAGDFYVYGSHIKTAPPHGTTPILMDAGAAFGTGEHATTSGCLELLSRIDERPKRVLDMGAGTAILGIAAAKRWPECRVLAVDYCHTAVRVSAANAARNHVQWRVHSAHSDGYRSHTVKRGAPYDIILANILAKPLMGMAADASATIREGGYLILSGLLKRQEKKILNAYRARNFELLATICRDDWSALLLRKAPATGYCPTQ